MTTTICGVIGFPIKHSLSQPIHNAAYKELGLNFDYQTFETKPDELPQIIDRMRKENIRGMSVTIPHKVAVIPYLDELDALAKKIGAVNTIVNSDGILKGYNTDCDGCMQAIEEKITVNGKKVALLGAGGAARAIAFGILERDGELTIFNRTKEKAETLASDVGASCSELNELTTEHDFDILINATSVGMGDLSDQNPVPEEVLRPGMIVHDIVYVPKETKLLKDAEKAGCEIVYGYKMLLYQGVKQFELFTDKSAPVEVMEKALLAALDAG